MFHFFEHRYRSSTMNHLIQFAVFVLLLSFAAGEDCPDIYLRFSDQHSYCLPVNTSCEILAYYPTQDEIKLIVEMHNAFRSVVATGKERLSEASDMLEIEWDNELSLVAQKYAEQCLYKHDCPNCRRVMNFGVGQNLAIQKVTGDHVVPQPDWGFAVGSWFNEIDYFSDDKICPFTSPDDENEYRHFTQIAWAKTFRVGCGYVLYKEGSDFTSETYSRLYVCNYGPAGNVYDACVYSTGPACSDCPANTCCGPSCEGSVYPGLCRRTNDKAPIYKLQAPRLFYCNFRQTSDCSNYIVGDPNWIIQPTLSGSYVGIVLGGGGNSTLVFSKTIQPISSEFCMTMEYRKGPNVDGDEASNTALATFTDKNGFSYSQTLPSYQNPIRQQFSIFNLTLSWNQVTEVKFSFAVPSGKPEQFFQLRSLLATDGKCQNN